MDKYFGYSFKVEKFLTYEEREEEQYGNWEEDYSTILPKVSEKVAECPDVVSTLDIKSGTSAFVVYVTWSSGDSFGCATGVNTEAVGIFEDYYSAEQLEETIEVTWGKDGYSVTTSDGQKFKDLFPPWVGLF